MINLPEPITFVWDSGNEYKSRDKHDVSIQEVEEAFFDLNKKLFDDYAHSDKKEVRYILLGQTQKNRLLYVAFTIRNNQIRAISARDLNKKERPLYEEEIENT